LLVVCLLWNINAESKKQSHLNQKGVVVWENDEFSVGKMAELLEHEI